MKSNKGKHPQDVCMLNFAISDRLPGLPYLINCCRERRTGSGFRFQTNDQGHQPHRVVIQLTLSGRCQCRRDGDSQWHEAGAGQAIVFLQPTEHIHVAYPNDEVEPLDIMLIGFGGQSAEVMMLEARGESPVVELPLHLEPIKRLEQWLPNRGYLHKRVDARTSAQLIWDMLTAIAVSKTSQGGPHQRLVAEAMDFMLAHLSTVTIDQIVEELKTSKMQLNRCFHEIIDTSPGRWLKQQKLNHIQDLLRDPELGLEEIAQHTGYSGATALIAAFQSEHGITPHQWRKSH